MATEYHTDSTKTGFISLRIYNPNVVVFFREQIQSEEKNKVLPRIPLRDIRTKQTPPVGPLENPQCYSLTTTGMDCLAASS